MTPPAGTTTPPVPSHLEAIMADWTDTTPERLQIQAAAKRALIAHGGTTHAHPCLHHHGGTGATHIRGLTPLDRDQHR